MRQWRKIRWIERESYVKVRSLCGRVLPPPPRRGRFGRAMKRLALALVVTFSSCGGRHQADPPNEGAQAGWDAAQASVRERPASERDVIAASVSLRESRCPSEMALVVRPQGAFCIDKWEASLEHQVSPGAREAWPSNAVVDGHEREMFAVSAKGRRPQGYVSGAQAQVACQNAGKRLCEVDEWVRACRGPAAHVYPYGDQRRTGVCNDRDHVAEEHPVLALFERFAARGESRDRMWTAEWMNDPRLYDLPHGVEPTGSRGGCKSDYGVYDMVGNVHEWTADPDGTFVGGYFMDTVQNGEGCGYRTRAHKFSYHDYSTGFRCCRDAKRG